MPRDRTTTSCLTIGCIAVWTLTTCVGLVARASNSVDASHSFPSEIRWTVEISAKPVGAPVASGDRLFVPLETGVIARRIPDAAELWHAKMEIAGALAVASDRVFVPGKAELRALSAETGKVVWTIPISLTAPPAVHGDLLFLAAGEELSAHRLSDGEQLWTRNLGVVEERPVVDGTRVYASVSDGRLVALILESGDPIWEFEAGIKPTEPLVLQERVYVGSAAKRFCSVVARDGTEDWCYPIGAGIVGQAAADDEHVYVVALDNQLHAHDRRNGARKWKKDLRYRPTAGPTLTGSTISAPGATRVLQAFEAKTGQPGPQLPLAEEVVQVPAFILVPGQPARLALLSGGLKNIWKLTLAISPPPPPPKLPVGPVTLLPGQVIPRGELRPLPE